MATTGYRMPNTNNAGFQFTNSQGAIYIQSRWVHVVKSSVSPVSDSFLYVHDGGTPASPGDEGNWARAPSGPSTDLAAIDTRTSGGHCSIVKFNSGSRIGILSGHGSSEQWTTVDIDGSGYWTKDNVALNVSSAAADKHAAPVSDTDGDIFTGFGLSTVMTSQWWDDAGNAWSTTGVMDSDAMTLSGGDYMISGMWRATIGGVACVCVAFCTNQNGGADVIRFAYRADSAALDAAWTTETLPGTWDCDSHVALACGPVSGETNSVCVVTAKRKSGSPVYRQWRRSPAGTWTNDTDEGVGSSTRVKLAFDATNGEVYMVSGAASGLKYKKSSAASTLSWGSEQTACENVTATGGGTDCGVPNHPVTSDTGLLLTQTIAGQVWWNVLPIAGAGGPILPIYHQHYENLRAAQ